MTLNDLYETTLRENAETRLQTLVESLLNPNAVKSYDDYRFLLGQIEALRRILPEICDETNQTLAER